MAKRFTDTEKWRDVWFQTLPLKYKLFWIYMLDECDMSGVWKPNISLAQFQIGDTFEEAELRRVLSERIEVLPSGYWNIRKFVSFQYGVLSTNSKPHIAILKKLEQHGILTNPKGIHTLKDKDKEKDKDKDKESELSTIPQVIHIGLPNKFQISIATKYANDRPVIIHDLQYYFSQQEQLEQLKLKGHIHFDKFMEENAGNVFTDSNHVYNAFRSFCKNYKPTDNVTDKKPMSMDEAYKAYGIKSFGE